jgi:flagellin-like hook-associated protein FlgL
MSTGIKTNLSAINALSYFSASNNTSELNSTPLQRLSSTISANTSSSSNADVAPTAIKAQTLDFAKSLKQANDAVGALSSVNKVLSAQESLTERIKAKANLASQDGQSAASVDVIRRDIEDLVKKLDKLSAAPSGLEVLSDTQYGQKYSVASSISNALPSSSSLGQSSIQTIDEISAPGTLSLKFINADNSTTTLAPVSVSDSNTTGLSSLSDSINAISNQTGVSASYSANTTALDSVAAGNIAGLVINGTTIGDINNIKANDSDGTLTNAINQYAAITGVTASVGSDGKLSLASDGSSAITVSKSDSTTTTNTTTPNYYSVSRVNSSGVATKYVNLNTGDEVSASSMDFNNPYVNSFYQTQNGVYRDGKDGTVVGRQEPTYANNPYTAQISFSYSNDTKSENSKNNRENRERFYKRSGNAIAYSDLSSDNNTKLSARQVKNILSQPTSTTTTVAGNIDSMGFGENGTTAYGALSLKTTGSTKVVATMDSSDTNLAQSSSEYSMGTMSNILADWHNDPTGSAGVVSTIAQASLEQIGTMKTDVSSNIDSLNAQIANYYKAQSSLSPANTLIPEVDFAKDSQSFNKSNVLTKAGSLIAAQSNITQGSVDKLLFPSSYTQPSKSSSSGSKSTNWSLTA